MDQIMQQRALQYARARETFLREAFPAFVAKMEKAKTLKAYLKEQGETAAEMAESLQGQMMTQPDPPNETFPERLQRFNQIPLVVDEIVKSEILYATP